MSNTEPFSKAWTSPRTQPGYYFNTASLALQPPAGEVPSRLGELQDDFDATRRIVESRLGLLFWPWFKPSDYEAAEWESRVENKLKKRLSLFGNTTTALQRVLLLLRNHLSDLDNPTLLTTDAEYPGVISTIDEYWNGPVLVSELTQSIRDSGNGLSHLKKTIKHVRPDVLFLSHVTRNEGWRVPDSFFKWYFDVGWYIDREDANYPWLIVDGAQSVGNVKHWISRSAGGECDQADHRFCKKIDFYITSLHKWLGGKPKLGLVVAGDSFTGPDHEHIGWNLSDPLRDPAQSISRLVHENGCPKIGNGGTSDFQALKSVLPGINDLLDLYPTSDHIDNTEGDSTSVTWDTAINEDLFLEDDNHPDKYIRYKKDVEEVWSHIRSRLLDISNNNTDVREKMESKIAEVYGDNGAKVIGKESDWSSAEKSGILLIKIPEEALSINTKDTLEECAHSDPDESDLLYKYGETSKREDIRFKVKHLPNSSLPSISSLHSSSDSVSNSELRYRISFHYYHDKKVINNIIPND